MGSVEQLKRTSFDNNGTPVTHHMCHTVTTRCELMWPQAETLDMVAILPAKRRTGQHISAPPGLVAVSST